MKILVCIKQVPETRDVEVDEKTGVLKREGVDSVMNPFDLYALEVGIQLKETCGGDVSVVSMGPPQAEAVIREAYMMGADAGYLLSDRKFAGADTLATAFTLAQGIRKIGEYDLILCGLQTTDGDTAQVGPGIAEFLGIPHEAYIKAMIGCDGSEVQLQRDMGNYLETVAVKLPCLVTVTKSAAQPRLLSFRRKLATRATPVTVWSEKDLAPLDKAYYGLDGSPTQVERIFPPRSDTAHERWEGDGDGLATRLFEKLQALKFA